MKKSKFILGVVVAISVVFAMTGCDLTIRDKYVPPVVNSIYVGLGTEIDLNVTKVAINGVADSSLAMDSYKPSAWNSFDEFITVTLKEGDYVEYTFTQPAQGADAYQSWALALYDNNSYGNYMRGDNWINKNEWCGWVSGKWSLAGDSSANGEWSNGYTYLTCASKLPTDAVVVVKVTFDGENAVIEETVNGTLAYKTSTTNW